MSTAIVWFRRDLRLTDNTALNRAVKSGLPILPVYVIDDLDAGGAERWWLHHSLSALDASLRELGGGLHIASGNPVDVLAHLAEKTDAEVVYCQHRYEPDAVAQLREVREKLGESVRLNAAQHQLLTEPGSVTTGSGSVYKVFTPFYRAASGEPVPKPTTATPTAFNDACKSQDKDALAALLPKFDWAAGFTPLWTPGERGAQTRLDEAVEKSASYGDERDRPDLEGTTRLSPHMHFGEVSVREAYHRLIHAKNSEPLVRQLYWREFSYHLLMENPTMPEHPLRDEFEHFPWVEDDEFLKRWQRGTTGYPIVDAGMRQLWQTGWMHNRVRMIVASFLVKHLLIPWQHGANWFLDTLVDADLANNSAGWQWVAGCGTDAAPYFRIFNPITQGQKFDPMGAYVREFCPELERVPAKHIHEPWVMDADALKSCGVVLGDNYPQPIVEHKEARQRALDAYQQSRDIAAAER